MNIKPLLKIAENLFNDGFTPSRDKPGWVFNVFTGEYQEPPKEILDILEFICDFSHAIRSKNN